MKWANYGQSRFIAVRKPMHLLKNFCASTDRHHSMPGYWKDNQFESQYTMTQWKSHTLPHSTDQLVVAIGQQLQLHPHHCLVPHLTSVGLMLHQLSYRKINTEWQALCKEVLWKNEINEWNEVICFFHIVGNRCIASSKGTTLSTYRTALR